MSKVEGDETLEATTGVVDINSREDDVSQLGKVSVTTEKLGGGEGVGRGTGEPCVGVTPVQRKGLQ